MNRKEVSRLANPKAMFPASSMHSGGREQYLAILMRLGLRRGFRYQPGYVEMFVDHCYHVHQPFLCGPRLGNGGASAIAECTQRRAGTTAKAGAIVERTRRARLRR